MKAEKYQQFTEQLVDSLKQQKHVTGLVALGSMAAQDYLPDEWSDHDFFVIVDSGHQEWFRNDLQWLPEAQDIIFSFRETAHGVKVLYRNAHLLEFAVFDLEELPLARINRFKVLFDRCNLEWHMEKLRDHTLEHVEQPDPKWLFGQFLSNLLVGVGRFRRGEQVSGHIFVKSNAIKHLALLCHRYLDSPGKNLLDNLDPFRRLEFAFPDAGRTLNQILQRNTPEAAVGLLEFAEVHLGGRVPDYPAKAVQAVKTFIEFEPGARDSNS